MNTNLEYFKTFYYVARCGSISAAAQQLFISQPAVSQIIKHLENDLGSSLFFRTTKGVRLTRKGKSSSPMWPRGTIALSRRKRCSSRCWTWNRGKSASVPAT